MFGKLKDDSLWINSIAWNNCISHRNVFQNGINALSKWWTIFCQKAHNFVYYGPSDFVQVSQPCGANTYQIMYGETLDFQCQHQQYGDIKHEWMDGYYLRYVKRLCRWPWRQLKELSMVTFFAACHTPTTHNVFSKPSNRTSKLSKLEDCIHDIRAWLTENKFTLNDANWTSICMWNLVMQELLQIMVRLPPAMEPI